MGALNLTPAQEPASLLIDVAGLTGDEHHLVQATMQAENEMQAEVVGHIFELSLAPRRALEIILSARLVAVGVLANHLDIGVTDYAVMAAAARETAEIAHDIAGAA